MKFCLNSIFNVILIELNNNIVDGKFVVQLKPPSMMDFSKFYDILASWYQFGILATEYQIFTKYEF